MTMQVTDPLRWWADNTPDQPAIVFDGRDTVSYRQLDDWSDRVAHRLVETGVAPGDRVGIVGPNSLEWCAGALGALKAGAITTPYNHRFRGGELRYLLANSEPKVVLADPGHLEIFGEIADGSYELLSLEVVGGLRLGDRHAFDRVEIDPDQPAVIVYTSGTTANPKGVIFTHRTIFAFILEYGLMEPSLTRGFKMIFSLGLAGCPGINWHLLQPLTHGGTVYLETGFDPPTTLRRLAEERINVFMA